MASVTTRISQINQPRGGYIKPTDLKEIPLKDGNELGEENVHASIVGMVVDYLTRYMIGKKKGLDDKKSVSKAFQISIMGYLLRSELLGKKIVAQDQKKNIDIKYLLNKINGLDDDSIVAACKMATYDVWFRNTMAAATSKGPEETNPDKTTINNIRVMVERSLRFWELYGPVVLDGFTFEEGGYTKVVDSGDGDYLTKDTLWDFKVSKSKPTNKHTLQLLMYWIMGQHTKKQEFKNITKIGIFNPRLNVVYTYDVNSVPSETIREIEKEVICYK